MKTKKQPKVRRLSSKQREHLAAIDVARLFTKQGFQNLFMPAKSDSWARGKLAEYKKLELLDSHEMPVLGGVYYFLTKHAARLLGVNPKYTHPDAFSPTAIYRGFGRMLFYSDQVEGIQGQRLLKPKEFALRFPKLAEVAPERGKNSTIPPGNYATDANGNLLATRVVELPNATRLVKKTRTRFARYLERPAFEQLIIEERFRFVLIVPSVGMKESIETELLVREKRYVDAGQAASKKAASAMLLRRTLLIHPNNTLGRFVE